MVVGIGFLSLKRRKNRLMVVIQGRLFIIFRLSSLSISGCGLKSIKVIYRSYLWPISLIMTEKFSISHHILPYI